MTKPLKILDVVQSYSPKSGGVKRYVHDKMRYVAEHEQMEHVCIVPGDGDTLHRSGRLSTYTIDSPLLPGTEGYRMLINGERIKEVVDQERPDVIEVGDAFRPAWATVGCKEEFGIPVVGFYHSDFPRSLGAKLGDWIHAPLLENGVTDLIETYLNTLYNKMSVTVTATETFQKLLHEIGVERVVRIPLGTDTEVFRPQGDPAEVRRELGLDDETRLILYLGRLAGMKNLPETFAMLDHLGADCPPVHLLVIGDGEEQDVVREATETRSNVTWYHYLSEQEAIARYYTAADLFINAGTHETFGLVSVEAQACGTRVLGVRGGGMDETLTGEEPLIMAASKEPEELARAVGEIFALPEYRDGEVARKMAHERREWMRERFSIRASFDRLFALYAHLREGRDPLEF